MLDLLREIATRYNLSEVATELDHLANEAVVRVGFLGDFSSGKSSLINAMVGHPDLLPVSLEPCTASAGLVKAVEGIETPEFFILKEDGGLNPTDRGTFDDTAKGLLPGRPVVYLSPTEGFPAGFIFLDTPGLSSLVQSHIDVTFGELPFLDAAVICVDVSKGGLSKSTLDFFTSPGIRHLHHFFLLALTRADKLPPAHREKVQEKTIKALGQVIDTPRKELAARVVSASALENTAPGLGPVRSAITSVLESRRQTLHSEHRGRVAKGLIPRVIDALSSRRAALRDSPEEFEERRRILTSEINGLEVQRKDQRARLEKLRKELQRDIQATCERFKALLAGASDDRELEAVSARFAQALSDTISNGLSRLDAQLEATADGVDGELKRVLQNINRGADLSKTLATAALTSWLLPGTGLAKGAAEAGGGAVAREIASKTAKGAAGEVVQQGAFKNFLRNVMKLVDDINPVNYVGDLIAQSIKQRVLDDQLLEVAEQLSTQVVRVLEDYFEVEVFSPMKLRLEDLKDNLNEVAKERREDHQERMARIDAISADLRQLQRASSAGEM